MKRPTFMQGRAAFVRPLLAWHLAALLVTLMLTGGLALLALNVSSGETVPIGTIADSIYIVRGFHDPERSAQIGDYRWTEPVAGMRLPNWGPGRINVSISGTGGGSTPSEATLKIDGVPLDSTRIEPGQPWRVQAWGVTGSRSPSITLEGPQLPVQGDRRELGRLVERLEIYAPEARVRAFLHLGLLALASLLLYACVVRWTARPSPAPYQDEGRKACPELAKGTNDESYSGSAGWPALALVACVAFLAIFGLLAVYRDRWTETVAWIAPPVLGALLLVDWKWPLRASHRISARWSTFFAVLALSAALMLLALGFLNAFDSERMYAVTAGFGEYGYPTRYPGRDTYTKYGFGQPLLAVPFYYLGKLGALLGGEYAGVTRFAVSLTNLPLTAFTLWLLYRASRRFASVGVALGVAATYLLATPALNYARTFFSEPAGAALLLASTLLLVPRSGERAPTGRRILLAGVCLGAMIWLKPAFIIHWLPAGLAILWLTVDGGQWTGDEAQAKDESNTEAQRAQRGTQSRIRVFTRHSSLVTRHSSRIRPLLLFAIGPMVAGVVQLGYNYLRYYPLPWTTAILRSGYEREAGFSTPLLEGLGGLLFSPGKSLFLYAPPLLLAGLGLWLMFRDGGLQGRVAALLIVAHAVVSLIFNALWWAWTGNFAWGPRLIITALPLLAWPLACVGEYIARTGRAVTARKLSPHNILLALWVALGVAGALVSIPGALVDFQVYYRLHGLVLAGDPGEGATIYDPTQSPLLEEPGYLLDGLTAAIHRPSLADVGMPPIWDWLVPGGLVAIAALCLYLATSRSASRRYVPVED